MDLMVIVCICLLQGAVLTTVILMPSLVSVLEGGVANLTCLADTLETGLVRWRSTAEMYRIYTLFRNNTCISTPSMPSQYELHCNTSAHTLQMNNVTRNRHGEQWLCEADFYRSNIVAFFVIVPVSTVQIQPHPILSTIENKAVQLTCTTSFARPKPNVTWFLTGDGMDKSLDAGVTLKYTNDPDELYSASSSILYVANRSNNGLYIYCSASNYLDTAVLSDQVMLNIKYPPSRPVVTETKSNGSVANYTVIEDHVGHLTCSVAGGNPQPVLTWDCFQDMIEITSNRTYITAVVRWTGSRDQSKTCTCSSSSVFGGTDSVTVYINVLYASKVSSFGVEGHKGKDTFTAIQNDSIQLICLFNSTAVDANILFKWDKVLTGGTNANTLAYTIDNVTCEDSGVYSCVGSNEYNKLQPSSRHMVLFVKCPPKLSDEVQLQNTIYASLGGTATFTFRVLAFPKPEVSDFVWMKETVIGLVTVNSTPHSMISTRRLDTSMTITSVTEDDYGKYQASVQNDVGQLTQLYTLKPATLALASNNVAGVAVGSIFGVLILAGVFVAIVIVFKKNRTIRTLNCLYKRPTNSTSERKKKEQAAEVNSAVSSKVESVNTYETIRTEPQNNDKDYEQITLNEDDEKAVYKNMQITQSSAKTK